MQNFAQNLYFTAYDLYTMAVNTIDPEYNLPAKKNLFPTIPAEVRMLIFVNCEVQGIGRLKNVCKEFEKALPDDLIWNTLKVIPKRPALPSETSSAKEYVKELQQFNWKLSDQEVTCLAVITMYKDVYYNTIRLQGQFNINYTIIDEMVSSIFTFCNTVFSKDPKTLITKSLSKKLNLVKVCLEENSLFRHILDNFASLPSNTIIGIPITNDSFEFYKIKIPKSMQGINFKGHEITKIGLLLLAKIEYKLKQVESNIETLKSKEIQLS